jgi:MFS family permease
VSAFHLRIYALPFFNGFILIWPLYTAMFVDAGLTPTQISICLAAWSVTAFVAQAPLGTLADAWSRRGVLAASQVIYGGCFALWLAFPGFWGFFAGLVLWGLKSAGVKGVFEALVYDELVARDEAHTYVRTIGRCRAAGAAGSLSAALGASLLARYGYPTIIATSFLSVAASLSIALTLPDVKPALEQKTARFFGHLRAGLADVFTRPALMAVMGFSALITVMGPGMQEYWAVFGRLVHMPVAGIALLVGAQNTAEILGSLLAHRISDRSNSLFYGLFTLAGVLLVIAASLFVAPAVAIFVVYSGVMRALDAVFEGRLQAAIPSERRATLGAVKNVAAQVGMTGLYLGFGPLAEATSYRVAFITVGVLVAIAGAAYMLREPFRARRETAAGGAA